MGARQERWAARKRLLIFEIFGFRCAHCKRHQDELQKLDIELQIDIVKPFDSKHHRGMGATGRVCFYLKQLAIGNVQLLCEKCNNSKSNRDVEEYHEKVIDPDNEPF